MAKEQLRTVLGHIRRIVGAHAAGGLTDQQLLDRFAAQGDDAAFAALVQRHGPLVWGVCWRALHHTQDAEDVFQATFLVLARKAGSVRWRESAGNWLYEVANRLATKAKGKAAERRLHERRAAELPRADPVSDAAWRELCSVLDEELWRLPDRLRKPLVLCYLQGGTRDQAAQELGWSLRTLDRRLEHGRELLRIRLTRRGLTLSAALLATALSHSTSPAAVPALLTASTVKAAAAFAANSASVSGLVSTGVAVLAEGGIKAMFLAKLQMVASLALVLSVLIAGAGVLSHKVLFAELPEEIRPDDGKIFVRAVEAAKPQGEISLRMDRYGDPLPLGAMARLGTIRLRHVSLVNCMALSPDGRSLVSGSGDAVVHLWDPATGKEVPRFQGHELGTFSLAFSPDGEILVSGGNNGTIRLSEVATGKELLHFQSNQGTVHCVAVSPDGKLLASGGGGNGAKHLVLWDLAKGKELFSPAGTARGILSVAFSPHGKILASGGNRLGTPQLPLVKLAPVEPDRCAVRLWDVVTRKELCTLKGHTNGVAGVAFSPDGKRLASASHDGTIRLWDPATGMQLLKMDLPPRSHAVPGSTINSSADRGGALCVAFSPDGSSVAAGSDQGVIHFWDVSTGKEIAKLQGHGREVTGLAFSPDGRTLFSGSYDHTLRVWDLPTGKTVHPLQGHDGEVQWAAFSPDGKRVVSLGGDLTIRVWDATTSRELQVLRGHTAWIYCAAFAPDSRTLVSASQDKTIRFWDVDTGKELSQLAEKDGSPRRSIAFSPDGKILAFPCWSGAFQQATLRLWDVAKRTELCRYTDTPQKDRPQQGFGHIQFAADGKTLLVQSHPVLLLLDAATGREMRRFENCFGPTAWSADGRLLATRTRENKIRLLNLATGKDIYQVSMGDSLTDLVFSPDAKMLAASNPHKVVWLWEVATGQLRRQFEGHQAWIRSLAFSPDGRKLISGSEGTTMLLWDVTGWRHDRSRKLLPNELQALWIDLSGNDAGRAYQAIWTLAAVPKQTIPFVRQQMRPLASVPQDRIAQWIAELDSAVFAVRQRAMQELETLGELAEPMLRKTLADQPALEVRERLESLLAKLDGPVASPALLQGLRAIEVLEQTGAPEAKQLLQTLASGAPEARLTREAKAALERLAKGPTAVP